MALELRKLSYALGAEVCGVDVAKPMSEGFFGEIYQAFLDHGILLFRDQQVTREQHIEFSRRFGELDRHDALPRDRHPDYPEILRSARCCAGSRSRTSAATLSSRTCTSPTRPCPTA
jgi:taurine dioxygenase